MAPATWPEKVRNKKAVRSWEQRSACRPSQDEWLTKTLRMSIREVLQDKVHGPYFRPPPLKIRVLAAREQTRVLSWEFGETTATPKAVKLNKVLAISDGQHFVKVTLFEEFSSHIKADGSYLMRGPYALLITRDTQFLRTSPVAVSEELAAEALSTLCPPSSLINIGQVRGKRGLVTVEGQISAVKKISVGREQVPKMIVRLQEDDDQTEVALWREAAVHKVELGASGAQPLWSSCSPQCSLLLR
ncbi:uncharacterized protein ACNS7B_003575 isoform 2-T2 [Menidia menidia]